MILACASDLLFDVAVYGGPVFLLAGFLWISTVRERRRYPDGRPDWDDAEDFTPSV